MLMCGFSCVGKKEQEEQLTHLVRKTLNLLEVLALAKGLETPVVYHVMLFRDPRELGAGGLRKVSEDVLVSEQGVIAVKFTDLLPLFVERVSTGYYALCLLKSGREPTAEEARRYAINDLLAVLSLLAGDARSLR